ncbi:hypothetical protein FNV43_RR01702 [Rhamnella rubrinervis]|uniref:F-box domain-containing protein n=1 Tax=Rhamnella rubrinervis TaxID=2594499 RepID=A0A8K0HQY4_9ROSA|nr:hypothetical protein FNV43_RR01702 [Rhamnella rubrinervis]
MARKRLKKNCVGMEEKENEPNFGDDDLLSQLPDSLIHRIFSFLPTIYFVRMSIVSRHWNRMWVSAPFIYLDDLREFNKKTRNRDKLLKFVSHSLRYRKLYKKVPETSITRFMFHTTYSFMGSASSRLKGWLNFVVQRNVKELDLKVHSDCVSPFILNASSLTVLKLSDLYLEDLSLSNFPCLKVLSFKNVTPVTQPLQNVISSCPVIEDLEVCGNWVDHVDFAVSKTLKYLSLSLVRFTRQWLESLISGLPLLERLALGNCCDAINISIHSHSLKSLYYYGPLNNISIQSHSLKVASITVLAEFTDGASDVEGTFITPNLVCLRLVCGAKPVISFEAPKLLEADLRFRKDNSMHPNDGIVRFLSNLNSVKKMVLCICEKDIIFSENIRSTCAPPLPNLKHLKVKIKDVHNELRKSEIMDSIFWCAPSVETPEIEESRDS